MKRRLVSIIVLCLMIIAMTGCACSSSSSNSSNNSNLANDAYITGDFSKFDKDYVRNTGLIFGDYEIVDRDIYYTKRKRRDEEARRAYMSELEHEAEDGIFVRDLMKEGGQ